PDAGWVIGIDSNGRNAQNLKATPPGHSMSGLRLATTQRELRRVSPLLILEMRNNPDQLSASPEIAIAGVAYPAVNYNAGNYTFTVMFDPQTGLPARVRTLDYDNVWGDVSYDIVLSDWTSMGGIRVAATQKYELNGRVITEVRLTDVTVNPSLPAARFDVPADLKSGAAKPATGNIH